MYDRLMPGTRGSAADGEPYVRVRAAVPRSATADERTCDVVGHRRCRRRSSASSMLDGGRTWSTPTLPETVSNAHDRSGVNAWHPGGSRAVAVRQVTPWRPGPQDPHNFVEHLPVTTPPPPRPDTGNSGSIRAHARSINSPRPTTTRRLLGDRLSDGRGSGCGWPPVCRSPGRSPTR